MNKNINYILSFGFLEYKLTFSTVNIKVINWQRIPSNIECCIFLRNFVGPLIKLYHSKEDVFELLTVLLICQNNF